MSSCKLVLKMFLCINCSCLKFLSPFVSYFKNIAIASISGNFSSFYKLNRLLCHCPRQYKAQTFRIFFAKEDKNCALTYNIRI